MRKPTSRNQARAGFTVLESLIAIVIFTTLLGGFLFSVNRMSSFSDATEIEYSLAASGLETVRLISEELGRAGYATVDGEEMPVFVENGEVQGTFEGFAHEPAHSGEFSRDIIYALPLDADGDGWPDLDADGDPVWDPTTYAIQCAPLGDGSDAILQRSSDGDSTIYSLGAASIVFEDPAQAGFEIPLDSVRFTVTLRGTAPDGSEHEYQAQRVVHLTNGDLAP